MPKILRNKSNVDLDYPICRPSLDLDFTQEVLDERITFSRGTTGTRVNRNRLIETVPANQPRFDYDPVTGECKGLLIEESRQNLLTYSEDFSNAIWTTSAANIINVNSTTSPTGSTNGNQITNNSITNNFNFISQRYTSSTKGSYTYSLFVKDNNISTISFLVGTDNYATNYTRATYTFSSQSFGSFVYIGTPTNWVSSASSTAYLNGWYKISITFDTTNFTSQSTLNVGFYSGAYGSTRLSYLKSFYVWGAQLEAGAFPTSYIPTGASTVTRSADNASMTGTNFSSWYNQSEGTIYTNNRIPYNPTITSLYYIIFGSNEGLRHSVEQASSNGLTYITQNMRIQYWSLSGSGILPANTNRKTTYAYSSSNNTTLLSGTSNQLYNFNQKSIVDINKSMTTLRLGRFTDGLYYLNGTISRFTYYPRRLKDNQLLLLTQ